MSRELQTLKLLHEVCWEPASVRQRCVNSHSLLHAILLKEERTSTAPTQSRKGGVRIGKARGADCGEMRVDTPPCCLTRRARSAFLHSCPETQANP